MQNRCRETLLELREISKLLTYLYASETNYIVYNNGIASLKVRMDDNCNFLCKNLNFPDVPEMLFNEQMTIPYMLSVIEVLKHSPSSDNSTTQFNSEWDKVSINSGVVTTLNSL